MAGADKAAEAEASGGKKSKKKLFIILGAVLLLGGGGGGAFALGLFGGDKPKAGAVKDAAAENEAHGGEGEAHGAEGEAHGAEGEAHGAEGEAHGAEGDAHAAKEGDGHGGGEGGKDGAKADAKPAGPVTCGAAYQDLPDILVNLNAPSRQPRMLQLRLSLELKSERDKTELEKSMPRILDQVQGFLRELRPEDLRGSRGQARLKEELLYRVTLASQPTPVCAVLFQNMVMQ